MSHPQRSEGEAAFLGAIRRSANPYGVDSEEWAEWMDGFDAAASRHAHPHGSSPAADHVRVLQDTASRKNRTISADASGPAGSV